MNDSEYRNCTSTIKNCKYLKQNSFGVHYCKLDGIINIENYGCVPARVEKKPEAVKIIENRDKKRIKNGR